MVVVQAFLLLLGAGLLGYGLYLGRAEGDSKGCHLAAFAGFALASGVLAYWLAAYVFHGFSLWGGAALFAWMGAGGSWMLRPAERKRGTP